MTFGGFDPASVENVSKASEYLFVYHKRDGLQERRGQHCRVIARGTGPGPRNKLLEFQDGFRCVTTFYGVRRVTL